MEETSINVRSRLSRKGESITVCKAGQIYRPVVSQVSRLPASSKCVAEITVPSLGLPENKSRLKPKPALSASGVLALAMIIVVVATLLLFLVWR